MISHGTADQMLDAFQQRLEVLDTTSSNVESATSVEAGSGYGVPYGLSDVKKYLNGRLEFYGNEIEMDFGDGLKLAKYLKQQGKQVNYCPSQETWSIPRDCHWGDCYFYPYEANLAGCNDDMLWDGKSAPVDSATSIKAAAKPRKKNSTHGTADQMLNAFEKKIAQLEGDVDASCKVEAADEVAADRDEASDERFIHTLIGDTNTELEDLDIFDSWEWEDRDNELVLLTVKDDQVNEYTVPKEDLSFDWDSMEEDVQYIIKAITGTEDVESVTSATRVEASEGDDKSVVIPEYAKHEFYRDYQGGFGGDANDVYSLEDLMIMWNSEHNNDPVMEQYSSFEDWWADTERWLEKVGAHPEKYELYEDPDGVLGLEPGETVSKAELRKYFKENPAGDPSLSQYESFDRWWADTVQFLTPVANSTAINAAEDYGYYYGDEDEHYNEYDEPGKGFTEIASKQVQDSDGFYTDYTMYRDIETGEYVFVFGDKYMYTPESGDFDWSCDTEQEAWEWFNDYHGFGEDEDDDEDDVYSATALYQNPYKEEEADADDSVQDDMI